MNVRSILKSESGFFEFLRKRNGIWKAAIVLVVGILLLSFGGGSDKESVAEAGGLEAYGRALEERVSELCSSLDGVGAARVMITFSSGEQTIYEGTRAVGTKPPEVMAVTVLCEGAGSGAVVARLTEMLSSVFGIGTHRIKIMKISSEISEYNGGCTHTI